MMSSNTEKLGITLDMIANVLIGLSTMPAGRDLTKEGKVIEYQGSRCRSVLDMETMKIEFWRHYQLVATNCTLSETLDLEEADQLAFDHLNELMKFCKQAEEQARQDVLAMHRENRKLARQV